MEMYDSDSDDSDYKESDTNNHENESQLDETKKIVVMSTKRKREVDTIWTEMNRQYNEEVQFKMAKSSPSYKILHYPRKKSKSVQRMKKMLRTIYGSGKATTTRNTKEITEIVSDMIDIKQRIAEAVKSVSKHGKTIEKVKFAGKEITVNVTTTEPSSSSVSNGISTSSKNNNKIPPPSSTIETVLETLKGPKTISTIIKSSLDWDTYKDQEGLQDQLAIAAKEGYLTKQEFLNRCDVRAFENEKEIRLMNQASTMNSTSSSTTTTK